MSYIIFNNLVDMSTAATPSSNGFTVAYDLDGKLKQKNQYGVVSSISVGGGISATPSISDVLKVGNITGTSSLIISTSSSIRSQIGSGQIHFGSTNSTSYVYISSDNGLNQESLIDLNDDQINLRSTGNIKQINIGVSNTFTSSNYQDISIIENKYQPSSVDSTDRSSIFIGTRNSSFTSGITNSVIIGGYSIQATESNTVYLGNKVNINNSYKLPTTDGSSNQVIKTDGQGNLFWESTGTNLASVLSLGNTSGNNDLAITSGKYLISTTGSGKIDLGKIANKVIISGGQGDSITIFDNNISIYATPSVTQSSVILGINNDDLIIFSNVISSTTSNTDKNVTFISSRNSSANSGLTNSVVIGGVNIVATQSNTTYVNNLQLQGNVLARYSVQPSTQPGWDELSIPTKQYVDSIFSSNVIGSGSASYVPIWSSTSTISPTSSIIDTGLTVSVLTNMIVNGSNLGHGPSNISSNTVFGLNALNSSITTGTNNTAIGRGSLSITEGGSNNVGVGISTLQFNISGYKNTAVGAFSLNKNTTGYQNTGIGYYSLYENLIGLNNVAIGFETLKNNTDGSYNVAVGNQALHLNQIGNRNTSMGYQSLYENTSGENNSSFGFESLYSNKIGNYNVSFGYRSLKLNTGSNNTALGASALSLATTSSNNTAIGLASLFNTNIGQNNTSIGSLSGYDNLTGSGNLFLGYNTGRGLTFGSNNTFVGSNITVSGGVTGSIYISDGSGNIRIMSDSNGKIGLNTTSPSTLLDINGDLSTRHNSAVDLSGSYDNYSTNSTSFLVFQNSSGSDVIITGFANGSNGKRLTIANLGPGKIILKNEDNSSLDINRIYTGYNENDLKLLDNQTCDLIYDSIENKWRLRSSFVENSEIISVGNVLYVSKNGNNSSAEIGKINKPWSSIQSAKNSANSGDIIYVLPGTWIYDNRDSNGNQYNGSVNSTVNLWKDGVTYYFSEGSKVIIYNQTQTGDDMYLFKPTGGAYGKCTVLGYLEYEQYSTGPDTYNGICNYFSGQPISTDFGYEFYSETRSLKSECTEIVKYERSSSLVNTTKITIVSEYSDFSYTSGQSGSAGMFRIEHTGTDRLEFKSNVKFNKFSQYFPFYISSNQNSYIDLYGNDIYTTSNAGIFLLLDCSSNIGCYFNKIYYKNTWTSFWNGCVVNSGGTGGWKLNIKSDLIDSSTNSHTTGIFWIQSSGNTLNFTGDINTNTNSGIGRFIAYTSLSNNVININGNIDFIGSSTTTNTLFNPNNSTSVINYTGRITGNFAGSIVNSYGGTTNISNSFIQSSIDNTNSKIFINGITQSGIVRINSSYIEMKNGYSPLTNGDYVKALINNSTIVNSGSQSVFYNVGGHENLQLLGSTVITNGTMSINYTGTSSVISSNSVVNKNFNIDNIYGNINIIDSLIY